MQIKELSQSGGATGSCVTPLLCSETCKDWIRWTYKMFQHFPLLSIYLLYDIFKK